MNHVKSYRKKSCESCKNLTQNKPGRIESAGGKYGVDYEGAEFGNERDCRQDEYIRLTGFHRKYAIAKVNPLIKKREFNFNGRTIKTTKVEIPKKKRKRIYIPKYGQEVLKSLTKIWQTFDYMCGQRLIVFIRENIDALADEPYFEITVEIRLKLVQISSATINKALKGERRKNKIHGTCATKAAGNLSKLIPVRVFFHWDERIPGFFEMDTVAHDGGKPSGEYCFTLTFTDVCLGWTVLYALLNKAHRWVKESAEDLRATLPYPLKGLDSDNGSEFKNHQMVRSCADNGIAFTRSRSYKKNDNCFVEQKNYSNVRHIVGYYRYEGEACRIALQNLYDKWNLLVNYFYPSMKILAKERKDAHTYKKYDSAKTPFRRAIESDKISEEIKSRLIGQKARLNVVQLKKEVEEALDVVLQLAKKWNQQ